MGFYINPALGGKLQFLREHGVLLKKVPTSHITPEGEIAVCLIDNGMFLAAGIAYSQAELETFAYPDGRTKVWWRIPVDVARPYLYGQAIEGIDSES